MKKVLTVLLALTLVAGLFAGGQQESKGDATGDQPLKIVLLVKSLGNGFFEAVADGGVEAAKTLIMVLEYEHIYRDAIEALVEIETDHLKLSEERLK